MPKKLSWISTDICVNPDDKTIFSVTPEGQVILLGNTVDDDDEMTRERCVVFVDRAMYHIAIDAWLDRKAQYHAHDYFGGEGCIIFTGLIKPDRFWLRCDQWTGGLLDGHEVENREVMVGVRHESLHSDNIRRRHGTRLSGSNPI